MTNTLIDPEELVDFPGSPFSQAVIDSVVAELRKDAGWHIAPEVTEILTVDGVNGRRLTLPSLCVVSVTEVRDVTDPATPVVLTGWTLKPYGVLVRHRWPDEDHTLEVELTHGYGTTPPDLLPLVASVASAATTDFSVAEQDAGPFGVKYAAPNVVAAYQAAEKAALDLYRVRIGF